MADKNLPQIFRGKRKALITVVVMTLVVASAVGWWLAFREPRYQGTSLSGWLPEFQDQAVERRLVAADAIRHIGPDAVPYLVKYLETDPVREKSRFSRRRIRVLDWLAAHTPVKISVLRHPSARLQALAALDALGPAAKEALPTLEKLIDQYPEEPDLVFGVARLGEIGVPVLKKALTNSAPHDSQTLRLAARVCLEMRETHSFVLNPELAPDPTFSEYLIRCGQFHLAMTQLSMADYRAQHPNSSNNPAEPVPAVPVPIPGTDSPPR